LVTADYRDDNGKKIVEMALLAKGSLTWVEYDYENRLFVEVEHDQEYGFYF